LQNGVAIGQLKMQVRTSCIAAVSQATQAQEISTMNLIVEMNSNAAVL
jgi:hypothetical protein